MKRTYLTSGLVITILAGLALTSGCVTLAKYKTALARNDSMRMELEKVRGHFSTIEGDNQDLTDQLDRTKLTARAAEEQLAAAEKQNNRLKLSFEKLAEEYRILAGKPPEIKLTEPVIPPQVDKALRAFANANPELLAYLPNYGMVKLKADLTFKKGSAKVSVEGQPCITLTSTSGHNGTNSNSPAGAQIAPSQAKVLVMP